MSSKQRKFANGYHTGYSDDHNDDSCEDVKENMKDNVVERAEIIKSKWAKAKHLMKDENTDSEFLNCFIKGIIGNKMKAEDHLTSWRDEPGSGQPNIFSLLICSLPLIHICYRLDLSLF